MSLLSRLVEPDTQVLEPAYYVLLESHVHALREHPDGEVTMVTLQQAAKYRGDFSGLLDSLGIDKKYHYLVTRVNGWTSSIDYDGLTPTVLVPPLSVVAQIIAQYQSRET